MFRATNSPIFRSTFWLYIQLSVQCTATINNSQKYFDMWVAQLTCQNTSIIYRCSALYQKLYIVKKCSWGWANSSPETCWAELKRIINEKVLHLVGYLHRCNKYSNWWPIYAAGLIRTHSMKHDQKLMVEN